ncbi:MAG: iron ABC transporter permease [Planctomycetota bacterium]|nr:iron ABC transporter permease [Planctomycetota bacterium]
MTARRLHPALALGLLALLLAAAVAVRLLAGGDGRTVTGLWGWPASADVLDLRVQRIAAGAVVGAALALAGVYLQTLLRNPLASPDLLGLASGAGLGVMLSAYISAVAAPALTLAAVSMPSIAVAGPAAVLGAGAALALVFVLSRRRGILQPVTLILTGVIVSIICSAGTLLVKHLMPDRGFAASRWLLGSISDELTLAHVVPVGALTLAAAAAGLGIARSLDASSLSDEEARSVGVPLARVRAFLFIASGILAAGAVVLAGPIGFVGLVCPHMARILAGPRHRTLIPAAMLAGAALLVGADALVKLLPLDAGRLPIGVITALIGGPVLIAMLRRGVRD